MSQNTDLSTPHLSAPRHGTPQLNVSLIRHMRWSSTASTALNIVLQSYTPVDVLAVETASFGTTFSCLVSRCPAMYELS